MEKEQLVVYYSVGVPKVVVMWMWVLWLAERPEMRHELGGLITDNITKTAVIPVHIDWHRWWMLCDVHHTAYMFTFTCLRKCAWLTLLWFLLCRSQAGLTTYLSTNLQIWRNLISSCAIQSIHVRIVDKCVERTTVVHLESKCDIWYHITDIALFINWSKQSPPVNEVDGLP